MLWGVLAGSRGQSVLCVPSSGAPERSRGVVSVPLYQVEAELFRTLGHPVRELPAGRSELSAGVREAGVAVR